MHDKHSSNTAQAAISSTMIVGIGKLWGRNIRRNGIMRTRILLSVIIAVVLGLCVSSCGGKAKSIMAKLTL